MNPFSANNNNNKREKQPEAAAGQKRQKGTTLQFALWLLLLYYLGQIGEEAKWKLKGNGGRKQTDKPGAASEEVGSTGSEWHKHKQTKPANHYCRPFAGVLNQQLQVEEDEEGEKSQRKWTKKKEAYRRKNLKGTLNV